LQQASSADFGEFRDVLIGLGVSHVWPGYGSALFIEFGELTPSNLIRRSGSRGNPKGQMGLMVGFGWRIERGSSIICGSDGDEANWPFILDRLKDAKVVDASLIGRLPEISLELTNGDFLVSFTSAEGNPEWALADHRDPKRSRWLSVREGRIQVETTPSSLSGSSRGSTVQLLRRISP
jgi:hypothetical protein